MDQLEEVLAKVDIVQLINSYIPLKRAGRNFKALCPFHSEKTPSFIISPELQIYKCFGCGVGGNAIKFVSEYEKITFGEALRFLADKVGVKLTSFVPDKLQLLKDHLFQINHLAAEFYHYILTSHKAGEKARLYLLGRGINKESIKVFKLGYAPAAWENLQRYLVRKKGYRHEEVEQAGLVINRYQRPDTRDQKIITGDRKLVVGNCYDRFRGRIMFPIYDHRGGVVGFSGRVLDPEIKEAKYVNTPETVIYHKSQTLYGLWQAKKAIKDENGVILVEGEFDTISSYQVGVRNVVAVKGSAVTEGQVKLLRRFTDNFYFCLDADQAGESAAKRGIALSETAEANIKVIKLKGAKDPDEFIRIDPSFWHKAVKHSIPVYDFYLQSAVGKYGSLSGEANRRISQEVLPLFSKITNEVVKAHYFKKLAEVLAVDQEAVLREAKRLDKTEAIYHVQRETQPVQSKSRKEMLEGYLVSLIFHADSDFSQLFSRSRPEFLTVPAICRLFSQLKSFGLKHAGFAANTFVKSLPEELQPLAGELYLADLTDVEENKEKLGKEWDKTWNGVEKLYWHDKLEKLKEEIKTADSKLVEKIENQIVEIASKLKEIRV